MDFGLCIVTTRDPNDVLYAFTQAEHRGFTFVGLFDSQYNFQDIYPHLGDVSIARLCHDDLRRSCLQSRGLTWRNLGTRSAAHTAGFFIGAQR